MTRVLLLVLFCALRVAASLTDQEIKCLQGVKVGQVRFRGRNVIFEAESPKNGCANVARRSSLVFSADRLSIEIRGDFPEDGCIAKLTVGIDRVVVVDCILRSRRKAELASDVRTEFNEVVTDCAGSSDFEKSASNLTDQENGCRGVGENGYRIISIHWKKEKHWECRQRLQERTLKRRNKLEEIVEERAKENEQKRSKWVASAAWGATKMAGVLLGGITLIAVNLFLQHLTARGLQKAIIVCEEEFDAKRNKLLTFDLTIDVEKAKSQSTIIEVKNRRSGEEAIAADGRKSFDVRITQTQNSHRSNGGIANPKPAG